MRFRITYTPYIETKLFTYKERKNSNELQTTQYYNQQANVISSEVLAELHDRVSKSNSGSEINVGYIHRDISEMLNKGKKIQDFVITNATHTIHKNHISSQYSLDEFFLKLNTYVAVLEKWRQFSIPNEGIVTRQFNIVRFAKFATTASTNFTAIKPAFYTFGAVKEVRILRLNQITTNLATVHPTVSFPFNNAIIWEATLPSNASAGSKSVNLLDTKRKDEPVRITDDEGRINENVQFMFLSQFFNEGTVNTSHNLPLSPGFSSINDSPYFETIPLEKDARERLAVSFQLHHVDTTNSVYINKGWSRVNGLVGGPGINDSEIFKATFNKKPYNKEIVTSSDIIGISGADFTVTSGGSIEVPLIFNGSNILTAKSWGIVRRTAIGIYEVLFWVNEELAPFKTATQLYINFDGEY